MFVVHAGPVYDLALRHRARPRHPARAVRRCWRAVLGRSARRRRRGRGHRVSIAALTAATGLTLLSVWILMLDTPLSDEYVARRGFTSALRRPAHGRRPDVGRHDRAHDAAADAGRLAVGRSRTTPSRTPRATGVGPPGDGSQARLRRAGHRCCRSARFAVVGDAQRRGRADALARGAARHDHEHDDRQHVRQRVEDLRGDVVAPRLEREGEAGRGAEQVGADAA